MFLYRIRNPITGKDYIGITTISIERRFARHVWMATGPKQSAFYLHKAIRKYGPQNFVVEQIGTAASRSTLEQMERAAIDLYATFWPSGYNSTLGGIGPHGLPVSAETRAKIAAANRGRKQSSEERARRSAALRGRKLAAEHVARSAASRRGMKLSPKHVASLSASHKGKGPSAAHMERLCSLATGRTCAEETRAKIGAGNRGRKPSAAALLRSCEARRGRPLDAEHRAKISEGCRGENSRSRLTAIEVREMRQRRALGAKYREIAERFGVSIAAAHRICARHAWGHVA